MELGSHNFPKIITSKPIKQNYVSQSGSVEEDKYQCSYVGFSDVAEQILQRKLIHGFDFNLLVVGASGLGKTTFINTLFGGSLFDDPSQHQTELNDRSVSIKYRRFLLSEGSVRLRLNIIDTPGFGDLINNEGCLNAIISCIEDRFNDQLLFEVSTAGSEFHPDSLIHCCLYFVAPTGHGLLPLDIHCMKMLYDRVNIIPLIAKADSLNPEELGLFKRTIATQLADNEISIYPALPSSIEVCKGITQNTKLLDVIERALPFAVIGSNAMANIGGQLTRVRQYLWGTVVIDDPKHSDVALLREFIFRTNLCDLIDSTLSVHYETYRAKRLTSAEVPVKNALLMPLFMMQLEVEKHDGEKRLQLMEAEMNGVLQRKLEEKMRRLQLSQQEIEQKEQQLEKALQKHRQELLISWEALQQEVAEHECNDEWVQMFGVSDRAKPQMQAWDV